MSTLTVGIDLGTTNCALAWTTGRQPVQVFDVPQLVSRGEEGRLRTLPSFLLRLEDGATFVAGAFARDEGALTPARLIASAKSWLVNAHVDRTAPLLPWTPDAETSAGATRLSPVEASARLLEHLRDRWNDAHPEQPLERQAIVVTVPASFDEAARELTADAARLGGFQQFTLLEEPLAALYAWIAAHHRRAVEALGGGRLILVCDVGGGTTDFSLVKTTIDGDDLRFERIAIGEHLLLGGDNLDLALAALVESRFPDGRLTLVQRQILRRRCAAAKELLLGDGNHGRVPITILGAGRGVVGGGQTAELTADDVHRVLNDGFLPLVDREDHPARDRRIGLRELGLPYETEPAITKHLAAFLHKSGGGEMLCPDAVLFNGGFFTPAAARERVLDALARWCARRPLLLENAHPEAAVAVGAAFYGRLRQDPELSQRLLIRAGSARSYYIGVRTEATATTALCIVPRGTDEGTRFTLDRQFVVETNRPASFALYSARFRRDTVGELVTFTAEEEVEEHAPLVTTLRYGKRSRSVPLPVTLAAAFTETGTLELWCESTSSDHRWRLAFNLRGVEGDPLEETDDDDTAAPSVLIEEDAVRAAVLLVRDLFEPGGSRAPQALIGDLENALGHAKADWPLPVLRRLADELIRLERGRLSRAELEVRWLNLTGFCVRPGFGSASDEWRVSELRKVYAAGLAFPREIQNQVEWIVMWGRVSGGFSTGQQRELAQRMTPHLGLAGKKTARLNPQIEREAWRLMASLERLDVQQKTRLGEQLLPRLLREPRATSWPWVIGRLGARMPLYGPLNLTVAPSVAQTWILTLLQLRVLLPEHADAVANLGAMTGDPVRDLDASTRERAAEQLRAAGFTEAADRLESIVEVGRHERGRIFGESLPHGLQLVEANSVHQ